MNREYNFKLPPEVAFQEHLLEEAVVKKTKSKAPFQVKRRSIDARGNSVKVNITVETYIGDPPPLRQTTLQYQSVANAPSVIIVGSGPAGLFAALRLIELGVKPIVLERGKDVRQRRRDIAAINKDHIVNPESNYCFGEGGAGTYSDGKLYTRSKKRGDIRRVLDILVAHGATEEILIDAHPHIGTNKLPQIVQALRDQIISAGGEVHFESKVTDLIIRSGKLEGVTLESGDQVKAHAVILATGHSARDIFTLLHRKKALIEAKPFALGVRVEHPQQLIDSIQYHCDDRGPYLPASAYSLAYQVRHQGVERGVFSFCMCPGGFIVPSATSPGEVVVNGMSPSRRNSQFANSGIVVAVELDDLPEYREYGPLAALQFQADIEKKACAVAGGTQAAPAQRLIDFVKGKGSSSLPETSYQPGLVATEMREVLPPMIAERLKVGFKAFGKKMKGYYTNEAQIVGVESRTSSPVKIPRDKETLEHIELKGLFPCGEGAGYAGGIVSAAMDGERCAEKAVALYINK